VNPFHNPLIVSTGWVTACPIAFQTVTANGQAVTHPVETIKGLWNGLTNWFSQLWQNQLVNPFHNPLIVSTGWVTACPIAFQTVTANGQAVTHPVETIKGL
ncbi:hypothetical protein, partial [Limosilactobacillus reuteri]|uniref:hypothetical protein n=1 Tax=Limosilactobacillus reuteri TaxID=1598 RepID=UPI00177FC510